ncbi:hypothetical protein K1719_013809 [Acacia pycnantha]|nr:hypothetical protein K1719_013809 [Acacia pycnantha]
MISSSRIGASPPRLPSPTLHLLFKDYHSDQKFSITTYSPDGIVITSSGTKKGDLFFADVNTQWKHRNVTTDIKVDADSNLFTTITFDEPALGLKSIFSFSSRSKVRKGEMIKHFVEVLNSAQEIVTVDGCGNRKSNVIESLKFLEHLHPPLLVEFIV